MNHGPRFGDGFGLLETARNHKSIAFAVCCFVVFVFICIFVYLFAIPFRAHLSWCRNLSSWARWPAGQDDQKGKSSELVNVVSLFMHFVVWLNRVSSGKVSDVHPEFHIWRCICLYVNALAGTCIAISRQIRANIPYNAHISRLKPSWRKPYINTIHRSKGYLYCTDNLNLPLATSYITRFCSLPPDPDKQRLSGKYSGCRSRRAHLATEQETLLREISRNEISLGRVRLPGGQGNMLLSSHNIEWCAPKSELFSADGWKRDSSSSSIDTSLSKQLNNVQV